MLRIGLHIAVLLALIAGSSPATAETPEEIFSRGNAAYEQDRFAEAAEAYRTLLKYKIRDARVEYNLGNTEFRLGNLGVAMLHFERAARLDPTDPDVRANLEFARSFCFDRVELPEKPALLHWVHATQDRLGPDRQIWIGLALFWALSGVLVWGLWRPRRWRAVHGWSLASLSLLLVLVLSSWYVTYQRLEGKQLAVVLQPAVEVLAGPGHNNPTLFTVHEGLTIEVRDIRPDWIQVSLPNGLNGWLSSDGVGLV